MSSISSDAACENPDTFGGNHSEHSSSSGLDTPIWGVRNIAKVINRTERQTFYLIASGKLPSVRDVGGRKVSTPRKLRADILGTPA